MGRQFVLAITGATGAAFGKRVLERLSANANTDGVTLVASPTGRRCLMDECGVTLEALATGEPKIRLMSERAVGADLASGSHRHDGMVILPCSAGTLGRLAAGISESLITRAADVCLKERRPLVVCLRETPLNRIHLENMLRLHDAGAVIMPLMPGYYHQPETLADLYDTFATRVLDQLGLVEADPRRWNG